jgi:acylphosphatase
VRDGGGHVAYARAMAERARAIRARVTGDVAGVGFREATVAEARRLGVRGWVRRAEDDDAAIAVHAEGDPAAVDALEAFLRAGPEAARVDAVETARAKVEGHEQFAIRGVSAGRFSVRGRQTGGYELRLEVGGADRAWQLAKEPSMVPADKRMAIAAEPGDDQGAPWDAGTYEQGGRVPWPEAIERGHAVFVLHGERLRGGFALQRTRGAQWLLVKRRDAYAASAGTPR